MLGSDHVVARRSAGQLVLTPLRGNTLRKLETLAVEVLAVTSSSVGRPRDELKVAIDGLGRSPADRKLARGLSKLLEDASVYSGGADKDAAELRARLFLAASRGRRQSATELDWNRDALVAEAAAEAGLSREELEECLFADLPSAQRLLEAPSWSPEELVARYDRARVQAVLLKAAEVRVEVLTHRPEQRRRLFRALKFRQLLYRLEALPDGGHRLRIDGPYSLFEAVTRYGLQLALLWPVLAECDWVRLDADLRWGRRGERLGFHYEQERQKAPSGFEPDLPLPDELAALMQALERLDLPFCVEPADAIIELPGVGLCVPDLTFIAPDGTRAHLELLGYWSRKSVWQRVDLVESGLPEPVLFAVSSRLRVSESVLDDRKHGALYVFRGRMSPKAVADRIGALLGRARGRSGPAQASD